MQAFYSEVLSVILDRFFGRHPLSSPKSRFELQTPVCRQLHSSTSTSDSPDRNAKLPGLVGQIVLDAVAGTDHDADRQHGEHRVVSLERRRLDVLRPVRLESDLRDLAVGRPLGGDHFGALGRAAVQQHHAGMLGVDLVEPIPDETMIVEVEAARDDDFGTGGQ